MNAANPGVACFLQSDFHGVRKQMETEAMRAAKLEQRLEVLTKGYVSREAALRRSIEATWETLQAAQQVPCPLSHGTAVGPLNTTMPLMPRLRGHKVSDAEASGVLAA